MNISKYFSLIKFLQAIKILSTLFGLGCFTYPSEIYKIYFGGVLMMVVQLTYNMLQLFASITQILPTVLNSMPTNEKIIKYISCGTFLMSFVSSSIVIVISFFMRKKLFLMFKKIEKFNEAILKLKIKVNDFIDINFLLILFGSKVAIFVLVALQSYPTYKNVIIFFLVILSMLTIYILLEIYIGIIYLVYRRVHYIVNELRYEKNLIKIILQLYLTF